MSLAVPGLSGADLVNTASVSYQDPSGNEFTGISNTVTVLVGNSLLPPVINGFIPFNPILYPSDTISVQLSGGPASQLNWVFTAGTSGAGTNLATAAFASGSPAYSISTGAPSLTLSAVAQLTAGAWHVSVTASNSSGTSAPAQGDFTLVLNDLSNIRVYPNPWRSDKYSGNPITFDQLTGNVTIKIFTVSAHLIKTLGPASGSITWDLSTDGGTQAASGLYIYLVTDDQGNKTKGKLAIIH